MATGSGNGTFYSAQAAETLASAQYKVGKLNSTGYLAIAAAATTGLGIIQNDAASGDGGRKTSLQHDRTGRCHDLGQ
jgi:hypothetical protein